MYSPLYIQSSFDFYELIFIEAVKLQQTPAKVPRELSKNCVWRNDNTTEQNRTDSSDPNDAQTLQGCLPQCCLCLM